jgi:hypothetical protein
LVNDFNPEWKDLSQEIGVDNDFVDATKEHYRGIAGQARNDGKNTQRSGNRLFGKFESSAEKIGKKLCKKKYFICQIRFNKI